MSEQQTTEAERPRRRAVPRNAACVSGHLKGMNMATILASKEGKKAMKKMGIKQNGAIASLMTKVDLPSLTPDVIEKTMRGDVDGVMEWLSASGSFETLTTQILSAMGSSNEMIEEINEIKELKPLIEQLKINPNRPIMVAVGHNVPVAQKCRSYLSANFSDPNMCLWLPDLGSKISNCDVLVLPSFLGQLKPEMFSTPEDFEQVKMHYDVLGMKSKINSTCILRSNFVFMIASSATKRPLICVSCSTSSALERALSIAVSFAMTFSWRSMHIHLKCALQDSSPVDWEPTLPEVRCNREYSTINTPHTVMGSIPDTMTNICFAIYS